MKGDLIHEVSIQGVRHGGARTVNLSFGFTFAQPSFANPKAPDTEYSYRIGTVGGGDRWWRYARASEDKARALADDMISTFNRESADFFNRFASFPDSFSHYEPIDFIEAPLTYLPPRIGGGRLIARDCWIFMKLWQHLVDPKRAGDFAKVGLENLGNAKALKKDFEKALNS